MSGLEIVYYVATSIDGFIATADGSVDWLSEFEHGSEDYGYAEFLAGVDALLIGRTTYEQVLTFGEWPYAGKPTWVFAHGELSRTPAGVRGTAEAPEAVAGTLAESGVKRAWLVGGGELAGAFGRAGLITSCIISVMPVLLGEGVPLFGGHGVSRRLALESSTQIGDVVQNVYGVGTTGERESA